jgi:hypothetical protein
MLLFFVSLLRSKSQDSSVGIAIGYSLHDRGIGVQFPAEISGFRRVLEPTQPPTRWEPAVCPGGVKGPGREADLSLHLLLRSRTLELYLHIHGMVLNC